MNDDSKTKTTKTTTHNSSNWKHWYALLCIVVGAAEYALVFAIAGAAFFALLRAHPSVAGALTHVTSALWMLWRYDRSRPRQPTPAQQPTRTSPWVAAAGSVLMLALNAGTTLVLRANGHGAPGKEFSLAGALAAAVVGPLCEECVFRRALLREARALAHTRAAVSVRLQGAVAGAAFGLMHVPAAAAAREGVLSIAAHVLFAAGFGAAATALDHAAGERLWPGALAHIANNALALAWPVAHTHPAVLATTLALSASFAAIAFVVAP